MFSAFVILTNTPIFKLIDLVFENFQVGITGVIRNIKFHQYINIYSHIGITYNERFFLHAELPGVTLHSKK